MSSLRKAVSLFWAVCLIGIVPMFVSAEIPEQINYQGRLVDSTGNPLPDGSYVVLFAFYESETTNIPQWQETQSILAINGIFNTVLPADTVHYPFPDDLFKGGRYLGITIQPDNEMTPRQLVTASPFAFWSKNSDMLEGRTLSGLDDRYVNEGQQGIVNSSMIEDGSISAADLVESYIPSGGGTVTGSLTVADSLSVGTDVGDDNDYIYMDSGSTEYLAWDDDPGSFYLSDDLQTLGALQIGAFLLNYEKVPYSRFGNHISERVSVINGQNDLVISGDVEIKGQVFADSNLYIGTNNTDDDDKLLFDDEDTPESLTWDDSENTFLLSNDFRVTGAVQLGSGDRGFAIGEVSPTSLEGWGSHISYGGIGIGSNNNMNRQIVLFTDGAATDNILTVATSQNDGASWEADFVIQQNGSVGIGTAAPANKLDVAGTIRAEEVIVEVGWADYVFEEKHVRMSLGELNKYITSYKHLPGIPTESEVIENGIGLGGFQVKMLEKIEELTLYLIEQNNRLEEQDKTITTLRQEIALLKQRFSDKVQVKQ